MHTAAPFRIAASSPEEMNKHFSLVTTAFVLLIFYGGALQYLSLAIDQAQSNVIILTQSDLSDLSDSGPLKYSKDIVIITLILSFVNMVFSGRKIKGLEIYIGVTLVQILFMAIGLVGVIESPDVRLFVVAGVRWNLVFNGSIALLCMCYTQQLDELTESLIGKGLFILSSVNSLFLLYQTKVADLYALVAGQGAVRLPGLFSHAGVAGTFAIGIALVCISIRSVSLTVRVGIYANAMFAALTAGSRQAIIVVISVIFLELYNRIKGADNSSKRIIAPILFVGAAVLAIPTIYVFVNDAAGRGDIFETQAEEGGRLSNFAGAINDLFSGDIINVFFGGGLGKATNNAMALLFQAGVPPSSYTLNYITDDTTITLVFQYGLIGAACFLALFIWSMIVLAPTAAGSARRLHWLFIFIILLMCFACNIFEQYFFITALAASIGLNSRTQNLAPESRIVPLEGSGGRRRLGSGGSRLAGRARV